MSKTQREAQRQMLMAVLYDFLRRTAQTHRGNLEEVHDQLRLINVLARQIVFVTTRARKSMKPRAELFSPRTCKAAKITFEKQMREEQNP